MLKKIGKYFNKHRLIISGVMILLAVFFFVFYPTLTEKTTSSVWDGSVATSFTSGNGTVNSPYEISTGSELAYFYSLLNGPNYSSYYNKYYVLSNNIDLNNLNFSYINYGIIFSGNFDGNGYTISNLRINDCGLEVIDPYTSVCHYALFYELNNANVSNMNIIGASITSGLENSNVATLAISASSSTIHNISLSAINYNITDNVNYYHNVAGLVVNDQGANNISNIFSDVDNTSSNGGNLLNNYNGSNISYIIHKNNGYALIYNNSTSFSNVYTFTKTGQIITFDNSYSVSAVIEKFNLNSSLTWAHRNNTIRLLNTGVGEPEEEDPPVIDFHDSGISGSTVYVNDYQADLDYFEGLNFTYNTDGTLPTRVNKNVYNSSNLVTVQVTYNGEDYQHHVDNSLGHVGYVSLTELQNKYVYYKVYEVNTNNTPDLTDDYIEFDLIDNPWANRPNNKAFNGWTTLYEGAKITLDIDTYVRSVKVPVTYESGVPVPIIIDFYTSWTYANAVNITNNNQWTNVMNQMYTGYTLRAANGTIVVYNLTGYYYQETISYGETFPSNSYYQGGRSDLGGSTCNSSSCTFFTAVLSNIFDPSLTYYSRSYSYWYGYTFSVVYPQPVSTETRYEVALGDPVGGFYREIRIPYGVSLVGYFDFNNVEFTSGTCNNSNGCVYLEYIKNTDANGTVEVAVSGVTYYYFITRDTNIIVLRANLTSNFSSQPNPCTITAINNGVSYKNSTYWQIRNNLNIYNDIRIEEMRFYSRNTYLSNSSITPINGLSLYGRWNNVKIGRGIVKESGNLATFSTMIGAYSSSSGNYGKYTFIVESGYYNSLGLSTASGGSYSYTFKVLGTYGNDYDRVNNINTNLEVRSTAAGAWGSSIYSPGGVTDSALNLTVKSGEFGTNKSDYISGIYVGGLNGGTHYSSRTATIEGGWIYNLIGGPLSASSMEYYNDTYMYIKGGSIDIVIGGAGRSATYGNRIIQHTGGIVNYSIFGGSNGIQGSDTGGSTAAGTLNGSSYVYVGGHAIVGDENLVNAGTLEPISEVTAGNVLGAGNGNSSSVGVGSVTNSYIVINGDALVRKSVYGGGNYGATGYSNAASSSPTVTEVNIYGGDILGTVYGAANRNGAGNYSHSANGLTFYNIDADINVNVYGGNISGGIYGGSNITGTVYGTTKVNVYGGNVNNVYGGGEGAATFVRDDVTVTIGNSTSGPNVSGNVYGGSAYGTVNATTTGEAANNKQVTVTVNNGTITGEVFGGAKGNSSTVPYVKGNIRVDINGGTTAYVYGGFDQNGKPVGNVEVHLNGGIVGTAFGGGKNTSIDTTKVYLDGSTCNEIYGGSNQSGTVLDTNITINTGQVTNIYGGNNVGGTCQETNVNLNGATILGSVYGGGNLVATTTTNVNIYNTEGTIPSIYGGGNQAGVTTTNVRAYQDATKNITVTDIYGGSNQSGTVTTSNVLINQGSFANIYGGNNAGGTTVTGNVTFNGTTADNIYGGGNKAVTTNTYVTINDGNITRVFGGGNEATASITNLSVNGGTINQVYGGGNQASVTTSNVDIYNGTMTNVFAGGNQAGATTTNVKTHKLTGGSNTINITNLYGGSNQLGTVTTSNVIVEHGTINQVYGGNNAGGQTTTTNVDILNGTLGSVYGGGNQAISGNTNVEITNGTITNLYGGGNKASVTNTSVEVNGGTITSLYGGGNEAVASAAETLVTGGTITNLYGGGNQAAVTTDTTLDVTGGIIVSNLYGGGNQGAVNGNTFVNIKDGTIYGSAYGGGNGETATVKLNTNITVSGDTVVGTTSCTVLNTCSVFGGGNAAVTGQESTNNSQAVVNIAGGLIYGNVYGGANTSKVYGEADVNIGASVVTGPTVVKGDILIKGTVFGGGEANASGSEIYDYSFISVTNAIVIDINGNNYDNFDIEGSIFGSGNASSSGGTSVISIKDYGTYANPKTNISIQRTDTLTIDNSSIQLIGATDRVNEYSDVLFTLSRIKTLVLKNNSNMFFQTGFNLVEKFRSVDQYNNLATVTIDEDSGTIVKNVDNRIYALADNAKALNIAKNQNVTIFGDVEGMSFFGLYKVTGGGDVSVGIYDKHNFGDLLDWGDIIDSGSYVAGSHKLNHDITVDGFYTNTINEDDSTAIIGYIEPTPPDSDMYMWVVGQKVIEYDIDLVASKYSTLGTTELAFNDFSQENTSFEILGFDYTGIAAGIELVDKNNVSRVAASSTIADSVMALQMESSNTGWLTSGTTGFLTSSTTPIIGTRTYVGDNTTDIPSLLFYLIHSKNIGTAGSMGTVKIIIMAITRIDDLTNETERLVVNVNLSRALYTTNDYEGAITEGRKYDLFATTNVKISSKSSFSTYFSLFADGTNLYQQGYHRALISNYVLPENTKITMIDLSDISLPEYYYHVITAQDVQDAINQLATYGDIRYNLSMFEVMGAYNSGAYYDDAVKNAQYYNAIDDYSAEEFIFIIDFEDTTISSTALGNSLLFELLDSNGHTIINVLGVQQPNMVYNIYTDHDASVNVTGTISKNEIYAGEFFLLDLDTVYTQTKVGGSTVYDTRFLDYKMGLKIYLKNSQGQIVSGTSLLGLYYKIAGVNYYPNIDGTIRVKIADKVGSAKTWVNVYTGTSKLATGAYKVVVEAFGSPDGLYYGNTTPAKKEFDINVINEIYGLDVTVDPQEMIIDGTTGLNLKNLNTLNYFIQYNSGLLQPNIHLRLYRRKYDTIYDTNFELVDLQDYTSLPLIPSSNPNDYIAISSPQAENNLAIQLKSGLEIGTYKLEFVLYDNVTEIGIVEKYFIIK